MPSKWTWKCEECGTAIPEPGGVWCLPCKMDLVEKLRQRVLRDEVYCTEEMLLTPEEWKRRQSERHALRS